MPLHEDERRKDNWIEGRAIQLEDDTEWNFPIPCIEFQLSLDPKAEPSKIESAKDTNRRFSQKYWDLQQALCDFVEANVKALSQLELAKATLPIAVNLLQRNYDISDAEALTILTLRPGDDRNFKMWINIMRVAIGIGPKHEPGIIDL